MRGNAPEFAHNAGSCGSVSGSSMEIVQVNRGRSRSIESEGETYETGIYKEAVDGRVVDAIVQWLPLTAASS